MATTSSNVCVTSLLSRCVAVTLVLVIAGVSQVTPVKLQKLCKDSDIQIMAHKGVKIEPYERSRVELKLAGTIPGRRKNRFVVGFDFKTKSANGTLFYGRSKKSPKEVIALILRDGRLRYIIQCPSLHADIILPSRGGRRVSDNKWHSIYYTTRFGRHGRKGHIEVDGHSHPKLYDVDCKLITNLVMGGHRPDENHTGFYPDVSLQSSIRDGKHYFEWFREPKWLTDVYGHFEGCIRNLNLSMFLSTPPKYYAVSECE